MNWKGQENKDLVDAVLALKNHAEAAPFLRELLAEEEIEEFARRFQTAQVLSDNVPCSQIQKRTGLSTTTIARVSKWLQGDLGGYRLVIDRLHHHASPTRGRGLR